MTMNEKNRTYEFTQNTVELIQALRTCSMSIVDDHSGRNRTLQGVVVYQHESGRQYVCPCFGDTQFCLNPLLFQQDAIHLSRNSVGGVVDTRGREWFMGEATTIGDLVAYVGMETIFADEYHGKLLDKLVGGTNRLINCDFHGDDLGCGTSRIVMVSRDPELRADKGVMIKVLPDDLQLCAKEVLDKPESRSAERSIAKPDPFKAMEAALTCPVVSWESLEAIPGVKALSGVYTQEEIQKAATWMSNEVGAVSEVSYPKVLHQVLQVHYPKHSPGALGFMTTIRDVDAEIFSKPIQASYLPLEEVEVVMSNDSIRKRLVGPWDGEGWDKDMDEATRQQRLEIDAGMRTNPSFQMSPEYNRMLDLFKGFRTSAARQAMFDGSDAGKALSPRAMPNRSVGETLQVHEFNVVANRRAENVNMVVMAIESNVIALEDEVDEEACQRNYKQIKDLMDLPEGGEVRSPDGKLWTKVHGRMVPEGAVQMALSSIHLDRD